MDQQKCIFMCFLSDVPVGKKQPKQVGKMPEIRKKFNFEVVMTFSWKCLENCRHNPQIFHASSLGLKVLTRSRSRLHHCTQRWEPLELLALIAQAPGQDQLTKHPGESRGTRGRLCTSDGSPTASPSSQSRWRPDSAAEAAQTAVSVTQHTKQLRGRRLLEQDNNRRQDLERWDERSYHGRRDVASGGPERIPPNCKYVTTFFLYFSVNVTKK